MKDKIINPCPFCGETEGIYIKQQSYGKDYWEVTHPRCGISIGHTYSHYWPKSEQEAIDAWNRRA